MKLNLFFAIFICIFFPVHAQEKAKSQDSITILFDFNQAKINEKTALILLDNSREGIERIILKAYTDSVGRIAYNQRLASKRLKSVYTILLKSRWKNIQIDTINANETFGTRLTNEDLNRRVDVIFIEKIVPEPENESPNELRAILNKPMNLQVNFKGGTSNFLSTAYPNLEKLLHIMQKDTMLYAQLDGHVCCADDYPLSIQRAVAVKKYLTQNGINPDRLKCTGYSNSRPLVPDNTEGNMSKNRRVEVTFTRSDN